MVGKGLGYKSLLSFTLALVLPVTVWAGGIWLRAALEPVRRADGSSSGTAFYRESSERRALAVEVHDISSTDLVEVVVGEKSLGFIMLDETGAGSLDLDTDLGDKVPILTEGAAVLVRDGYEGFRILQGTLERVR
ncbi:MAG TPA: hypothetical protein VGY77_01190 [Gemmataceae bacterium]|nr:hypothetical protein [Gemmataceae bacterium]